MKRIITFIRGERIPEAHALGFEEENRKALLRLNSVVGAACIAINILSIAVMDPAYFSRVSGILFLLRLPMIAASLLAICTPFVPFLHRYSIAIADAMILFIFLFATEIMYLDRGEPLMINTWVLMVVLGVGLYPAPLSHSLAVFGLTFGLFIARYLASGNSFSDRFLQLALYNTLIAVLVSSAVKAFFFRARQSEYSARRGMEEANAEMTLLYEKLRSLDDLKSDFITNISHELRTPLSLIVSPIAAYFDGSLEVGDFPSFLEGINVNANRLKTLVNDILDFAKIDSGQMELSLQEMDIGAAILALIDGFALAAKVKGVSLKLHDQLGGSVFAVDRDKFEKIIVNVLANALKFTDPGGSITVTTDHDQLSWRVNVKDSGPGIRPDLAEGIFERFRQADDGSGSSRNGTGIGLALAKEFMSMHGGRIELKNQYIDDGMAQHGCEFILYFPLVREAVTKSAPPAVFAPSVPFIPQNSRAYSREKPRILVVEDNPEMGEFLLELLKADFEPVLSFDGAKALSELRRARFDIVLSDLMMPNVDGRELVRRMGEEGFGAIPVVILSARADQGTIIDSINRGAVDYIVKPFVGRELVARLRSQAHLKQLRDSLADQESEREASAHKRLTKTTSEKLKAALSFIKANYKDDITRESLAMVLNLSPDHLGRMFKQMTGRKISDYLMELRLEAAAESLNRSDRKILDIAMDQGFESLRTFNRVFQRRYGKTPKEYRAEQRAGKN